MRVTVHQNAAYNSLPADVARILKVMETFGLYGAQPVVENVLGAVYADEAYWPVDLEKQDPATKQCFGIVYNYTHVNVADLTRVTSTGVPENRVKRLYDAFGILYADAVRRVPAVDAAWRAYQNAIAEALK